MGYNLRREFLIAHKEDVDKLIRLARDEDWQRVVCNDPESAMRAQYLINNLLFSLARWEPSLTYVRDKVRTKLEWEPGGKIAVYVGVPPAGMAIRGTRPQPVHIEPAGVDTTLSIEEEITSDNWSRIASQLIGAIKKPWINTITIRHPPELAGIRWIAEKLEPHFAIEQTQPTFVLTRCFMTNASA